MCTILFAYKMHPKYDFIYLGNRDEFFKRETTKAEFNSEILMGKDLSKGGTWLGINKKGKFSFVTNYRDFSLIRELSSSRGELVTSFLKTDISNSDYLDVLIKNSKEYNPYNLVYGDINEVMYYNNISNQYLKLDSGIYGLSNGLLDYKWYKVEKARKRLLELISKNEMFTDDLFNILDDEEIPEDGKLPDTGIDIDLERKLSPIHVNFDNYGTVFKTVMLIDKGGNVTFKEKNINDNFTSENVYEFRIVKE